MIITSLEKEPVLYEKPLDVQLTQRGVKFVVPACSVVTVRVRNEMLIAKPRVSEQIIQGIRQKKYIALAVTGRYNSIYTDVRLCSANYLYESGL